MKPASPTKIRTAVRNRIPQLSDPTQVYPALKGNGYIAWHSLAEELTSLKDRNSQYCTLERAEQSIEMFKEIFSVEGLRRLSEGQNSAALNLPAAPVAGALPESATTTIINPQGLYHECCQAFRAVQQYTANVVKNDYVRKVYAAEFYCRYAMLLELAELELLRERLGVARKRGVGKDSLVTRALI